MRAASGWVGRRDSGRCCDNRGPGRDGTFSGVHHRRWCSAAGARGWRAPGSALRSTTGTLRPEWDRPARAARKAERCGWASARARQGPGDDHGGGSGATARPAGDPPPELQCRTRASAVLARAHRVIAGGSSPAPPAWRNTAPAETMPGSDITFFRKGAVRFSSALGHERHHPVGTAGHGRRPDGSVDLRRLRCGGLEGLRVIAASVMRPDHRQQQRAADHIGGDGVRESARRRGVTGQARPGTARSAA